MGVEGSARAVHLVSSSHAEGTTLFPKANRRQDYGDRVGFSGQEAALKPCSRLDCTNGMETGKRCSQRGAIPR
jgi:hypothetical protein